MRSNVPVKLLKIVDEIRASGNASLTKLTVLKKWFERPERLTAFAIWIAMQAAARKGKAAGATAKLFREAEAVLSGSDRLDHDLDRAQARDLHDRLQAFQNDYQNQQWGPVRIIHNWDLMLVEQGLAIYLWHDRSPSAGYKLAADYCQHYDSRYGNGLNGPSRTKVEEIARFISTVEALEERGK